jgi:transcriptional regulator with PAS, ATPase and Fis domain
LVESELFGCEKGAYTGAEFRRGRFEQATGGTLFLDEIGELSLTAQPKLLRVLQERKIDRIGAQHPIPVDFRLIVATNRNLEEMMAAGRFREDLYDRLNIATVYIPPLRERLDDIPFLAEYFIGVYVQQAYRMVEGLEQPVLDLFQQYWWPGNVRELENVVQRAVFKTQSERIGLQDIPFDFIKKASRPRPASDNYRDKMRAYSRQLILDALTDCGGNRSKAIAKLDLSRAQFYKLAKKHGLDWVADDNRGWGTRVFD